MHLRVCLCVFILSLGHCRCSGIFVKLLKSMWTSNSDVPFLWKLFCQNIRTFFHSKSREQLSSESHSREAIDFSALYQRVSFLIFRLCVCVCDHKQMSVHSGRDQRFWVHWKWWDTHVKAWHSSETPVTSTAQILLLTKLSENPQCGIQDVETQSCTRDSRCTSSSW